MPPKTWTTGADVAAPPAKVFRLLATQDGLKAWWGAMAPFAAAQGWPPIDLEARPGPSEGAGMAFAFGMGGKTTEVWTVVESQAPERVVYDVDFGAFKVRRTLAVAPRGGGARVTWSETADLDGEGDDSIIANFDRALGLLARVAAR